MTILKGKSKDNITAANYLFGMGLFAPSIHCSYYACLQLSKSLVNAKGKTYAQQNAEITSLRANSHNYIINETKNYTSDPLGYIRNMNDLKARRVRSDYQNMAVRERDATTALSKGKSTIIIIGI